MPPLFLILSAWCVLFFSFSGVGLCFGRWFGLKGAAGIFDAFWLGWALVIFFLQIWHLFFPVNSAAFFVIFIWGLAGLLYYRKPLNAALATSSKTNKIFVLILAALAFFIAMQASRPAGFYDVHLYYSQTVRWLTTHPIIPGLGNLHGRLAFNQSYFLYVALLESWSKQSTHLANGVLLLALLAEMLLSLRIIFVRRNAAAAHDVFNALLFPAVFCQTFLVFLPSASPDLAVFIISILLASRLLRLLEDMVPETRQKEFLILWLTLIAILGVTIKITLLVLGGVAFVIALGHFWLGQRSKETINFNRTLLWVIFAILVSIVPWCVRGVILTGYLAYPLPLGSFPVEWRLPRASVALMFQSVSSYGHTDMSTKGDDEKFFLILPLIIGAFGLLASLFTGWTDKNKTLNKKIWPFLIPFLITALFWYISSPNLRFGMALFWVLGAGLFLSWINGVKYLPAVMIGYIVLVGGLAFRLYGTQLSPNAVFAENRTVAENQKNQRYRPFKTDSGLVLSIPFPNDLCWDTPDICTPYPNPALRLKDPENINKGFRVEPFDENDATVGFLALEPMRKK